MTDAAEFLVPFLGALQASFSVLLTIAFGVVAAQTNLLSANAAKEVSKLCVRMFLPALLIYKIGSNLHQDTGVRYIPIVLWSILYTMVSLGLGCLARRLLKLPTWVPLALAFNNTTSLPLLLVESLKQTQILDAILTEGDTSKAALHRTESYFLVNAMISNSLTFAFGPRLLKESDAEDSEDPSAIESDEEVNEDESRERGPNGIINEATSLLPPPVVGQINQVERASSLRTQRWLRHSPCCVRHVLSFLWQFANAPLLGAFVGAIIGLTPVLHRLFFDRSTEGGYLNAWLTTSIKNIGDLFASTQIIVVGVKLSQSMLRTKRGEESGVVCKKSLAIVTISRFIVWPLILVIWVLVTRTKVLDGDPMLWFSMMLMPTGPPAMILVALMDVTGAPEQMKMTIAKLLTISYAITPLMSFAVVGSLKATGAAMNR